MTRTSVILCGAALALASLTSVADARSIPSSPAERAATAALNRQISMDNAAADQQHAAQQAQYQAMMREYEARQAQYQAQIRN